MYSWVHADNFLLFPDLFVGIQQKGNSAVQWERIQIFEDCETICIFSDMFNQGLDVTQIFII